MKNITQPFTLLLTSNETSFQPAYLHIRYQLWVKSEFHLISGISSLSYAGGGKNSSLMQKKSVFTIAYDDMASSNIQPPSSATGVPAKEEQKLIN